MRLVNPLTESVEVAFLDKDSEDAALVASQRLGPYQELQEFDTELAQRVALCTQEAIRKGTLSSDSAGNVSGVLLPPSERLVMQVTAGAFKARVPITLDSNKGVSM